MKNKAAWVFYPESTAMNARELLGLFWVKLIDNTPITAVPFKFMDIDIDNDSHLKKLVAMAKHTMCIGCANPILPDGSLYFGPEPKTKLEKLKTAVQELRTGGIIDGLDFSGLQMRDITTDWAGLHLEACNLQDASFAGCHLDHLSIDENCNIAGCLIPIEAAPGVLWARNQK